MRTARCLWMRAGRERLAEQLRANPPKSELWFYELYKRYQLPTDEFNVSYCGFIPDVINKTFRYVIEIDGSIHNRPDIQLKDARKDKIFKKGHKYLVVRIEAYNEVSFAEAMKLVIRRRGIITITRR